MKVKDLITLLQEQNPEAEIYGCEPSDGNGPTRAIEPELALGQRRIATMPCNCGWQDVPDNEILKRMDAGTAPGKCYKCMGTGRLEVLTPALYIGWSLW